MNEKSFNSFELVRSVWIKKWHLIILGIAGLLIGVFISSPVIMKPKFESKAIVYPTNIASYSEESKTEQMLQWLRSGIIKNSVIDKLNLINHYGIDTTKKYYKSTVKYLFQKNVTISKTRYESVEIIATDHSPEMAYKIVSLIIEEYNDLVKNTHKEKSLESLKLRKEIMNEQQAKVDSLSEKLEAFFKEDELYNFAAQTEETTKGYLKTVEGASKGNINNTGVTKIRKSIKEKGVDFIYYNKSYNKSIDLLNHAKEEYLNALKLYLCDFTYLSYVTKPEVPDKKSWPIRWIVTLLSGIALFSFGLVYFIINNSADQYTRKK